MASVRVKITLETTDGKKVTKTVEVNPDVKTLVKGGKSYRLGHQAELANKGKLTAEQLKESPALEGVSKEDALKAITEAFVGGSPFIKEVKEAKEAKDSKDSKEAKGTDEDEN